MHACKCLGVKSFGLLPMLLILSVWVLVLTSAEADPSSSAAERFHNLTEESAAKLRNPCALADGGQRPISVVSQSEAIALRVIMHSGVLHYTRLLNTTAFDIMAKDIFADCLNFNLALVPNILPEDSSDISEKETLRLLYTTQMDYTARVYFMVEQLQRQENRLCPKDADLSKEMRSMVVDMRMVMCFMKYFMNATEDRNSSFFTDVTKQVLIKTYQDQTECSRRYLQDCQVISSALVLFREVEDYFNKTSGRISRNSVDTIEDLCATARDLWAGILDQVDSNFRSILMELKSTSETFNVCPVDLATNQTATVTSTIVSDASN